MQKMNKQKGLTFIVLSPSGGGKGSILKEVMEQDSNLKYSVSATTRKPRPGEIDGQHYHFIEHAAFEKLISDNKILEYAEYCGNYYGTLRESVERFENEGYDVILEIEVQGGAQVKKIKPDAVSIFILPPSMQVLEKRLRRRGTETEEVITGRLAAAREEIPYAESCDYIIVNDDLKDAVLDMQTIIKAEKLKAAKNIDLIKGVLNNA